MTDNEIVKVLECCVTYEFCTVCPLVDNCPSSYSLLKSALDLIKRQKAEIERLKAEADMADGYEDAICERARTEAKKEFAEMVKKQIDVGLRCGGVNALYLDEDIPKVIDNLVKEMVGDAE